VSILLSQQSVNSERHVCSVKAWFGDLGDGIHKGDENDPRVVIIDVTPSEVSLVFLLLLSYHSSTFYSDPLLVLHSHENRRGNRGCYECSDRKRS
jgi:hypothetical protein